MLLSEALPLPRLCQLSQSWACLKAMKLKVKAQSTVVSYYLPKYCTNYPNIWGLLVLIHLHNWGLYHASENVCISDMHSTWQMQDLPQAPLLGGFSFFSKATISVRVSAPLKDWGYKMYTDFYIHNFSVHDVFYECIYLNIHIAPLWKTFSVA